jgi:hypothetical protein
VDEVGAGVDDHGQIAGRKRAREATDEARATDAAGQTNDAAHA